MRFEWEPIKAAPNERKHGVTFGEASTVFCDVLSVTGRDLEHSTNETRFITLGLSSQGQLLAVCHTDRGDMVRVISARMATRKERKIYEEG